MQIEERRQMSDRCHINVMGKVISEVGEKELDEVEISYALNQFDCRRECLAKKACRMYARNGNIDHYHNNHNYNNYNHNNYNHNNYNHYRNTYYHYHKKQQL